MKYFAIASFALVANAVNVGEDCFNNKEICETETSGLTCADWYDTNQGNMQTCEDCTTQNRGFKDSANIYTEYTCPSEASADGGDGGNDV